MKITNTLTDRAVLEEIGQRLAKQRLSMGKNQTELANESGLARRTIQNAEAGQPVQSESLIKILRSLGLLDVLDALLPDQSIRPMDLLKLKNKERQRVGKKRTPQKPQGGSKWEWGEESPSTGEKI
jgi:transcriptional regulator with XRE-family HTH domain